MGLKFYLNKYVKVDNIENYTLGALKILQGEYTKFLEESGGVDPDFPMFNFGGNTGGNKDLKIKGQNKAIIDEIENRNND